MDKAPRGQERLTKDQEEWEIGLSKDLEEELHRKSEGHHCDKVHPAREVERRSGSVSRVSVPASRKTMLQGLTASKEGTLRTP
jgi:hypothetical protein